jgi:hypothetical protein
LKGEECYEDEKEEPSNVLKDERLLIPKGVVYKHSLSEVVVLILSLDLNVLLIHVVNTEVRELEREEWVRIDLEVEQHMTIAENSDLYIIVTYLSVIQYIEDA